MRHGSLFSGIGGFDLAASWMGWENVFHCEINPFGRKVLNHYWPESISYDDITKTDFTVHRGNIDILTGGFPCQPFSTAGKRKGTADDRHLWPEMLRAIREIQPKWIVGENVPGIISWSGGLVFEQVCADLEAEGYEVQPVILPAVSVNAPHRRDRVWFIAHINRKEELENNKEKGGGRRGRNINDISEVSAQDGASTNPDHAGAKQPIGVNEVRAQENKGRQGQPQPEPGEIGSVTSDSTNIGYEQSGPAWNRRTGFEDGYILSTSDSQGVGMERNWSNRQQEPQARVRQGLSGRNTSRTDWTEWPTQSPICGRNDGLPSGLSGITFSKHRNESLKAYGNAVVPQVVYQIFKAIENIH